MNKLTESYVLVKIDIQSQIFNLIFWEPDLLRTVISLTLYFKPIIKYQICNNGNEESSINKSILEPVKFSDKNK